MALTSDEMLKLRKTCDQLDDGPDYRCTDYVHNLLNTALDFYMRSTASDAAINYFNKTHGIKTLQDMKGLVSKYADTSEGNQSLAKFLWNNNHWSRARFLRKIIDFFEKRGETDQSSLDEWVNRADFEKDIKNKLKTDEHSIGYRLFQWLRVRCGVNTVKPDLRVIKFITEVVGRKVTPLEAVISLEKIAKDSNRRANRLDSAIWHFMEQSSGARVRSSRPARIRKLTSKPRQEGKQTVRAIIDPAHIRAVLGKFIERRFNTLEFANEFKASFPEDWETLVSKYGQGGTVMGTFIVLTRISANASRRPPLLKSGWMHQRVGVALCLLCGGTERPDCRPA
jgi:hypothetical protein